MLYKSTIEIQEKNGIGGGCKVKRQERETLVVVEMSPCHIFHSQAVQYYTNTL